MRHNTEVSLTHGNAVQETLYLNAIPGMSASILAADAEDLDACRTYDPNEAW